MMSIKKKNITHEMNLTDGEPTLAEAVKVSNTEANCHKRNILTDI